MAVAKLSAKLGCSVPPLCVTSAFLKNARRAWRALPVCRASFRCDPLGKVGKNGVFDKEEAINALRNVNDLVRWGVSRFHEVGVYCGHGTDNAIDEALALVLHALHLPFGLPPELLAARLTESERRQAIEVLSRRINERLPNAYLTHEAWFAGLKFYVDERVLVPRSPIAELIASQFSPWVDVARVTRILDLCTGSGCIAIACAYAFPEASVDAVDLSADALCVARRNVDDHGVNEQVRLLESDLFGGLVGERYDLIVSNPPYVDAVDMAMLPPEYRHEPTLGLAAGEDGLDIVVRILQQARHYLSPEGVLIVEVGNSQHALLERYPEVPFTWLGFAQGGEGVFLMNAHELESYGHCFA